MTTPGYLDGPPLALAHRGFSRSGLENSLSAFESAVALGFTHVETDVHATADGELLAFHDDTLDRVTDGTGAIAEQPWETVSRALIGGVEPIPRLADVLRRWPDLRVNIDVKAEVAIGPLVQVIEEQQAHDRVCVTSFSDRRRRHVLARLSRPVATSAGQTVTAAFMSGVLSRLPQRALNATVRGVDALQIPVQHKGIPLVTPRSVQAAHRAGLQVHVWTVNDPAQMNRLLDLGVDGLVTDRADLLRQVLLTRGGGQH